jgi:hypothetical protein
MNPNITYEVPTCNQIYEMLLNQAQTIHKQNYTPDVIVGIARGGLVPVRILADLLSIRQLVIIQIEFYTDIAKTKQAPTLTHPINENVTGKKVLIVDDIADSGHSLKLAKTHLQEQGVGEIKTATLYMKTQSLIMPDFYCKKTSRWVVFPWDTKETLRKIIQNKSKEAANLEIAKLVKAGLPKQLVDKLLEDMQ